MYESTTSLTPETKSTDCIKTLFNVNMYMYTKPNTLTLASGNVICKIIPTMYIVQNCAN